MPLLRLLLRAEPEKLCLTHTHTCFLQDGCASSASHRNRTGDLDLQIKFEQPLAHNITIMAMGIFDATLYLDLARGTSVEIGIPG